MYRVLFYLFCLLDGHAIYRGHYWFCWVISDSSISQHILGLLGVSASSMSQHMMGKLDKAVHIWPKLPPPALLSYCVSNACLAPQANVKPSC